MARVSDRVAYTWKKESEHTDWQAVTCRRVGVPEVASGVVPNIKIRLLAQSGWLLVKGLRIPLAVVSFVLRLIASRETNATVPNNGFRCRTASRQIAPKAFALHRVRLILC